ncbi:PREDICTED: ankyrin repeat and SAM domain-containing protein 1A-like [Rhagoletis zephyria]|uniref:ankyrin repeat and SAM domain-containing protein 1A-like n=1 Tax=Rhagoletis zephyria TaxID=28612 RepID=UPI0008112D06|nr:PREDICTED: ankyrin repeat and SAM domain-containing protein 1A-like [Rhagoletis zephyria]
MRPPKVFGKRNLYFNKWKYVRKLWRIRFCVPKCFRRSPCINSQDVNGYTPLHHACLNGHINNVRLLLAHNAVPDMPDIRGSTPLYLAAWAGHDEIIKQLLLQPPKAANQNMQTIDNETPLHCAAQHGQNTVLAILLAYDADPTVRNNSFQTALDLAAQFGR